MRLPSAARLPLLPLPPRVAVQGIRPVRLQEADQLAPLLLGERGGDADVLELAGVVPQAQQQRADHGAGAVLVPAEAGHHAIGGAQVLDLGHLALAGQVAQVVRAWRSPRPARLPRRRRTSDAPPPGRWSPASAGPIPAGRPAAAPGPRADRRAGRRAGHRRPSARQSKATNEAGVSRGQHRHARRGGMDAQQQGLELQPAVARDHDLAVEHEAGLRARPLRAAARGAPGSIGPAASGPAIAGRAPRRRGRRGPGSHPTSARSAIRRRRGAREWAWPASARWEGESERPYRIVPP